MRLSYWNIFVFLIGCAAALALVHLIVTYRDRGSLTVATAAVAAGKSLMVVRKLLPARIPGRT